MNPLSLLGQRWTLSPRRARIFPPILGLGSIGPGAAKFFRQIHRYCQYADMQSQVSSGGLVRGLYDTERCPGYSLGLRCVRGRNQGEKAPLHAPSAFSAWSCLYLFRTTAPSSPAQDRESPQRISRQEESHRDRVHTISQGDRLRAVVRQNERADASSHRSKSTQSGEVALLEATGSLDLDGN